MIGRKCNILSNFHFYAIFYEKHTLVAIEFTGSHANGSQEFLKSTS